MTKNQAIRILAFCTQEYLKGSGCGLRSVASQEEKTKIKMAINRLVKDDYRLGYVISLDYFNNL